MVNLSVFSNHTIKISVFITYRGLSQWESHHKFIFKTKLKKTNLVIILCQIVIVEILPECPINTAIRHKHDVVINPMSNTIHVETISHMIIHVLMPGTSFYFLSTRLK